MRVVYDTKMVTVAVKGRGGGCIVCFRYEHIHSGGGGANAILKFRHAYDTDVVKRR
jgi:hypothetical protein